jgi:hypothetical protein
LIRIRPVLAALMLSVLISGFVAGPAYATYWCSETVEMEEDTGFTSGDGQYMEVHHVIEVHDVEYDESGVEINRVYRETIHDDYHWRLISDPNDTGYCTDFPDATLC